MQIDTTSLEYQRYHTELPDGGPFYTETDLTRELIIEPWNAVSSLLFLIPAFYWIWKIRKQRKQYRVLLWACIFLVIGGLGSTLFHGLRISPYLLLMDWVPMQILMLIILFLCWTKVMPKAWQGVVIVLGSFVGQGLLFYLGTGIAEHTRINIGYGITGLLLFIPLIYILVKSRWVRGRDLLWGGVLLAAALFFREVDARENFIPLPMGTHFLWHVSSAIAAHFIANYLYWLIPVDFRNR
ncbi:MAG TPA: hypothetical protein DCE41_12325 [Cytophagales bacterium]|nr:hypothetical protein [Cytophagales bacterium]HAA23848.1 hypothetical protein [Cytophagales bacterium]HAP58411.1 hypothetical protein [Cytophagales bacterium]